MNEFLLNRFLIPLVLTAIFFYFQAYWKNLENFLKKRIKNKRKLETFLFLLDCLKVKRASLKRIVFVPIVYSILLEVFLSLIFHNPLHGFFEPVWFAGLTSGFLSPIAEEFLTRAVFLGFCGSGLLAVLKLRGVKFNREKEYAYYFVWLLISSLVFVLAHENFTLFQFILRFSLSMLYGILYLVNRRNVLPSIVAHASANWFIILKDYILGFESII